MAGQPFGNIGSAVGATLGGVVSYSICTKAFGKSCSEDHIYNIEYCKKAAKHVIAHRPIPKHTLPHGTFSDERSPWTIW